MYLKFVLDHCSLSNPLQNIFSTVLILKWPRGQGRYGKIFLRGQSHFSCFFFPVENFHFGRPKTKTNFSRFKNWKGKRKKKWSSPHFVTFPPSIFNFTSSFFTIFLLFFSIYPFFLASFFLGRSAKNFPVRSLWGHSSPCPLPPPPPVTPLSVRQKIGRSTASIYASRRAIGPTEKSKEVYPSTFGRNT